MSSSFCVLSFPFNLLSCFSFFSPSSLPLSHSPSLTFILPSLSPTLPLSYPLSEPLQLHAGETMDSRVEGAMAAVYEEVKSTAKYVTHTYSAHVDTDTRTDRQRQSMIRRHTCIHTRRYRHTHSNISTHIHIHRQLLSYRKNRYLARNLFCSFFI